MGRGGRAAFVGSVFAVLLALPGNAAEDGPALPAAPEIMPPLHRGADGQIEIAPAPALSRSCVPGNLCVGPKERYTSLAAALAAARPGSVVALTPGRYHETVRIAAKGVTVRGIGGRAQIDCAGLRPSDDKACFVIAADGVILDTLEISGAVLPAEAGANAACIGNEDNASFTLRAVTCHGAQAGIVATGGDILIENSEFFDNGWSAETDNAAFDGACALTVRGSIFRDARAGDELTARCRKMEISDSTFRSTKGAYALEFPDGGNVMVYRSTVVKMADAAGPGIIGFAALACPAPGDLTLKDVHIRNSYPGAEIRNFGKCEGHPIVLEGVAFEGARIERTGYILKR